MCVCVWVPAVCCAAAAVVKSMLFVHKNTKKSMVGASRLRSVGGAGAARTLFRLSLVAVSTVLCACVREF